MPLQRELVKQGSVAPPSASSGGGNGSLEFRINFNCTIGKGATCIVKMAQHSRSKQLAVVKMVNLPIHSNYFNQERTALSRLNHKNIVKLLHSDEPNGYLFLEYVPFPSLFDYIQHYGRLSEETAFKILYQIVDAFIHMHSMGISHQDFKPENICYDPSTHQIKILDFGLSLYDDPISSKYSGSPLYQAPEIHEKKPYNRYSADIWGIGISFYEMVTGDTPFADCTDIDELSDRLLSEQSDPIRIPQYLSSTASNLLQRMLTRDPIERITIAGISQQLEQIQRPTL